MSAPVTTEKSVQAAVLEYLNTIPQCRVWRQNAGAMFSEYTSKRTGLTKKRFTRFGVKGQSDVTGVIRGLRIDCEIKRPNEVPTLDQTAYLAMIRDHGGIAFWCDSLGSCVEQLEHEFGRRGWKWSPTWNVR